MIFSVILFTSWETLISYSNSFAIILSLRTLMLGIHCRNTVYDSSIGGCLHAVHSSCPDDVVKLTAADLVYVFSRSVQRTKSPELKVNWLPHLYLIYAIVIVLVGNVFSCSR